MCFWWVFSPGQWFRLHDLPAVLHPVYLETLSKWRQLFCTFSWQCWRLNPTELPLFWTQWCHEAPWLLPPACANSTTKGNNGQLLCHIVEFCLIVSPHYRLPYCSCFQYSLSWSFAFLFELLLSFAFTSPELMNMAASLFLQCFCGSIAAQLMGLRFFFFSKPPTFSASAVCPQSLPQSPHLMLWVGPTILKTLTWPAGLSALICCRDGFSADLHLCYESSGSCRLTGELQSVLATSLFSLLMCVLSPIMLEEMWWTHSTSLCFSLSRIFMLDGHHF